MGSRVFDLTQILETEKLPGTAEIAELLYAPHSSVKGLPGLPVQELPDIIAGGGKSEQKEAPQRLLPLGTN